MLPWCLRDILSQLEHMLTIYAQHIAAGNQAHTTTMNASSKRVSDTTVLTPCTTGNVQSFTEHDVSYSLKQLQRFLVQFTNVQHLNDVINTLMNYVKTYDNLDCNRDVSSASNKEHVPSSTDKKTNVDDKHDNSITFFIVDTIYKCIEHSYNAHHNMNARCEDEDDGAGVIKRCNNVIAFSFHYLQCVYTPGIRYKCSQLLAILSKVYLSQIISMFMERFTAAKNDQAQREFVPYQSAIGMLEFNVTSQRKTTLFYLESLLNHIKNVDRGVLRQEICTSLEQVFTRILSQPQCDSDWQSFVAQSAGVEEWHVWYDKIFTTISKWSSKSKHSLFCWELLVKMLLLCRNTQFFMNKKRFDIIGELIKNMKKDEFRLPIITLLKSYVKNISPVFIQADAATFATHIKQIITILLPKKTKPLDVEIPSMIELLSECGKKQIDYFINEVVIEIMKPNSPYYTRQKTLMLHSLSHICASNATEVEKYNSLLGPIVSPLLEVQLSRNIDDKHIRLLRGVLSCFPVIRHTRMELVQITCAHIIQFIMIDDRDISALIPLVLTRFITLDITHNFLPTLHAVLDLLMDEKMENQPELILKILNIITLLLNTLHDILDDESKSNFHVTSTAWSALREHVECVTVTLLLSNESWLRTESLRVLQNISRQRFRDIEATNNQAASPRAANNNGETHYLWDYLTQNNEIAQGNEAFYAPLHNLLSSNNFSKFSGIFSFVFSHIFHHIKIFHSLNDAELSDGFQQDEWYVILRNKVIYLSLVIRPTSQQGDSEQLMHFQRVTSTSSSSSSSSTGSDDKSIATLFSSVRPRLNHHSIKINESHYFYDTLLVYLHHDSVPPTPAFLVRYHVAKDLSLLHSDNFDDVSRHLKRVASEPPHKKKHDEATVDMSARYYLNDHVLHIYSNLYHRFTAANYHSAQSLFTQNMDNLLQAWQSADSGIATTSKAYIVSITKQFIAYRNIAVEQQLAAHISKDEVCKKKYDYFKLLLTLYPNANDASYPSTSSSITPVSFLLQEIFRCLLEILKLAAIDNEAMENEVLSFLERNTSVKHKEHDKTLHECYYYLLFNNFHYLSLYLSKSFADPTVTASGSGARPSFINKANTRHLMHSNAANFNIAYYYLKALYNVWQSNENFPQSNSIISLMLVLGLLGLTDASSTTRALSLSMCQSVEAKIQAVGITRSIIHPSPQIYIETALRYSQLFANHGVGLNDEALVSDVISQFAIICKFVKNQKRQVILQLALPWVKAVVPYILSLSPDTHNEVAHKIITSLLEISRHSYSSSYLLPFVHELWSALFDSKQTNQTIVNVIVNQLVKNYEELDDNKQLEENQSFFKLIVISLARSVASLEVYGCLFSSLRAYRNGVSVPLNVTDFLAWSENRVAAAETITKREQAAYTLLVDCIYELHHDDILNTVPLLLHTVYTFYDHTVEGHELLTYLILSLELKQDGNTQFDLTPDADIPLATLISALKRQYPQLYADWSSLALSWATLSVDAHISARSFQILMELEKDRFFFGHEHQEALIQLMLFVFHGLKNGEIEKLSSIVRILSGRTLVAYDKLGWCALLVIGWSLCYFSSIPYFQMGLDLIHSLLDANSEEGKRWILSLGRFVCTEHENIDEAIVEVLGKGLLSKQTIQSTIHLLNGLCEIYSIKTLNVKNKLIVLMMMGNIMMRIEEIENPELITIKQDDNTRVKTKKIQQLLTGMNDSIHLSSLLFQYSQSTSDGALELYQLSSLFLNISRVYQRLLPSQLAVSDKADENTSIQQHYDILIEDLKTITSNIDSHKSKMESQASNPFASDDDDSKSDASNDALPSSTQLSSNFFTILVRYYNTAEDFTYITSFFESMLPFSAPEWKLALLTMFNDFLSQSSHYLSKSQFSYLAELFTQSFMASNQNESKRAEVIIRTMIAKRPQDDELGKSIDLFNFIRPKVQKKLHSHSSTHLYCTLQATEQNAELLKAITKIDNYAFSEIREMATTKRPLTRADQQASRTQHWRHISTPVMPTTTAAPASSPAPAHAATLPLSKMNLGQSFTLTYSNPLPPNKPASNTMQPSRAAPPVKSAHNPFAEDDVVVEEKKSAHNPFDNDDDDDDDGAAAPPKADEVPSRVSDSDDDDAPPPVNNQIPQQYERGDRHSSDDEE